MTGCAAGSIDYPQPVLRPDQVIGAVTEHLDDSDVELTDYELESFGFDYIGREWLLMYSAKNLGIGDHFGVQVSDEDFDRVSLIPGL